MPVFGKIRGLLCRFALPAASALLLLCAALCPAATIRGIVTDISGARVRGATVALVGNGKVVGSAMSAADGSFQINTGGSGRFFLLVSASSFRQLQTPDFYAGLFDAVDRNLVLEPAWVRESIVVTANGAPTPQAQTSSSTTVLGPLDLDRHTGLTGSLRLMPGVFVAQAGQSGAQTSLFIRGGNPDANKVLIDGIDAGDLGGQFDFGTFSSTAIESAEVYRGPNSNLYGANAASGTILLTTPHGTTHFPSLIFQGDTGNFNTSREEIELAGARQKLDYLAAFSWLQTSNALPNDQAHRATTAANLGWALSGSTQLRATLHYGVAGTGVPNAWDFYHVADDATQKDQDLYLSASIDNQTTPGFHNNIHYGLARKREQSHLWTTSGTPVSYTNYCFGPGTLGKTVTIAGANGYSVTGQAVLDCGAYQYQIVSNHDQLIYRGDIAITPHLAALVGFQYENERGAETYYASAERNNYDYIASVHGDFKNRFFYTLGGSLQHYSLFGTQTSPRAGFSLYALRPRSGVFSGTRILFNYGDALREPKLTEEFGSLYKFLTPSQAQQLHIGPLQAPTTRTYEGGVEQSFLSQHVIFRTSYFHNQFGKEIESVGTHLLISLIPGLTPADLGYDYTYDSGLYVNTEAFRAQGVEANVETGIGRNLFFRGGYTYLDTVVQRSFSSDNEALLGGQSPTYNGIPIGAYSPLKGARPFRRPPHTGFFTATYAANRITGAFTSAFASRSDDSTYLEGADASGGNSLLLPNRNLDHGYARLGLGGSFRLLNWVHIYLQGDNLLSNQHIAPIGYPSLPMTFRTGLRFDWGLWNWH